MASTTTLRRSAGVLISMFVAILVVAGFSGTAHAVDGYKFWNYFHATDGAWTFSQEGASAYKPADGTVEGYRFGTTTANDTDGLPPRADLAEVNFETICGNAEAGAGQKRVGVVIDYGTEADANGLQVLQAVADVRIENSFSCAIDGYPAQGCGDPVADATDAGDEQPVAFELPAEEAPDATDNAATEVAAEEDGNDLLFPLVLAGVVVIALGAGAFALNRRNPDA